MHNKSKKFNAFSLAEMLIALGIIAVLAMLAVPVLNSKKTAALAVKFRKAYSTTEYIVNYLINESGNYLPDVGFADTRAIAGEGLTNKFCYWFKDALNVKIDYECPNIGDNGTKLFAKATDDILWHIYPAQFTTSDSNFNNKIIVDVNGEAKPNCFSSADCATYKPAGYSCNCEKPDTFIIGVRYDGKVNIVNDEIATKILEDQEKF